MQRSHNKTPKKTALMTFGNICTHRQPERKKKCCHWFKVDDVRLCGRSKGADDDDDGMQQAAAASVARVAIILQLFGRFGWLAAVETDVT